MNLLHMSQLMLNGWAIAAIVFTAPRDDPIASTAPRSKCLARWSYEGSLRHGGEELPALQRSLQRLFRVGQDVPLRSDKFEEAFLESFLS